MKKKYLFLSIFFAVWLGLIILWYDFHVISRAIFQYFANGRSFFKEYFFLAWASVSFLLLSIKKPFRRKISKKWLVILIIILACLSLFSHLLYLHKSDLYFQRYSVAVTDRELSTTRFMQIHTLKGVMIPVIQALNLDEVYKFADPGLAHYEILPKWIYLVGLLLAISIITLCFYFLIEKEKEWTTKNKLIYIIIYIISSFNIVKTLYDGGPLNGVFIIYFPAFIVTLFAKNEPIKDVLFRFLKYCSVLIFLILLLYFKTHRSFIYAASNQMILYILFILTLSFLMYILINKQYKLVLVFLLILFLLVTASRNHFWYQEITYLNQPLFEGQTIYLMNFYGRDYRYPIKYQDGDQIIHSFTLNETIKVWDIQRQIRLSPSYKKVKVNNRDCRDTSTYTRSGKLIAEDFQVKEIDSQAVESFEIIPCTEKQFCTHQYNAFIKGCVPEYTSLPIINHLHEIGFSNYILIPDHIE